MDNYATREEVNNLLDAHLRPIRSDVSELKEDVKTLILASAQQSGVQAEQGRLSVRNKQVSDRFLAYAALLVGALAPLAWIHPGIS